MKKNHHFQIFVFSFLSNFILILSWKKHNRILMYDLAKKTKKDDQKKKKISFYQFGGI